MKLEAPVPGATLRFRQLGTYDTDDDVYAWSLPDGAVLLEVRGPRALRVELRAGDVVEVATRAVGDGDWEDTEVSLVRAGARTAIASGGTGLTVGGLHGATLAAQLRACAPAPVYEVRFVRTRDGARE